MIKFSTFLKEIFDSSKADFEHVSSKGKEGREHHIYKLTHGGETYNVHVRHITKGTAHVDFTDSNDDYEANAKSPFKAHKVFGAVRQIMKHHAEKHGAKTFLFSSDKNEPSRERLYNKSTAKVGGSSRATKEKTLHSVDADKL